MSDELKQILDKLTGIESRQGNIEQGIINLGTRLEAVEGEIESLKESNAKIEARLNEQLDSRFNSIGTQISELHSELTGFRTETERNFRALNNHLDTLSGHITRLQAGQRDLEERIEGIERKAS